MKFEWYATNWVGFEFESHQGKWRVMSLFETDYGRPWMTSWKCRSIWINPGVTIALDADGCGLFNHHQLMSFYIDQLEGINTADRSIND